MVMVNEWTGEKYARGVGHKGMGKDQDMKCPIKDMSNELKLWGQPGETAGNIILKSNVEPSCTCSTRCPGEAPWRQSRTRRGSCR